MCRLGSVEFIYTCVSRADTKCGVGRGDLCATRKHDRLRNLAWPIASLTAFGPSYHSLPEWQRKGDYIDAATIFARVHPRRLRPQRVRLL
jgi:hypothetical protein